MALDYRVLFQQDAQPIIDFDKEEANGIALQKERMAMDEAKRKAGIRQRLSDILRGAPGGMTPGIGDGLPGAKTAPGFAGGQVDIPGGQAQPSLSGVANSVPMQRGGGSFDRFGGRSLKDIYTQLQAVDPAEADSWLKGQYELDEAGVTVGKAQADTAKQWADVDSQTLKNHADETARAAELMRGVRDQATLEQARARMAAEGIDDVEDIPGTYTPGMEQSWITRAMTAVQAATQELDERQFRETQRHNRAAEGTAAGNLAVARGRLGVARERLAKGLPEFGISIPSDTSDLDY